MGRHLDIDFCAILVDLGSQVGKENETKIKIKKCQNLKGFWWGGGPGHVGEEFSPSLVGGIPPRQSGIIQKYCMLTLFWHERASYKSCEA